MYDTKRGPQSRISGPRRPRAGAAAAALAATALLVAACGGSSTETNTFAPGATYAQTLAFATCMRAHGVPQFPNPDREGNFSNATIQALESSSSENNVLHQCRSVLPNAGTGLTMTEIQQIQEQNLRDAITAAECMRAHGITNFADPKASNQASGVNWQPVISAGLNTSTPSYEAAFTACKRVDGIIPFAPGPSPGSVVAPSGPASGSPPPGFGSGS